MQSVPSVGTRRPGLAGLAELAGRAKPVSLAEARILPVLPALVELFPEGGLRRGTVVAVSPGGGCGQASTSLAGALLAGVTAAGSWGAVAGAGVRNVGLHGLAEMGADLSRLALVDTPARDLPGVLSALLDAVDVVLLAGGDAVRPTDARRLAARARERGSVLVVLQKAGATWPMPTDQFLVPMAAEWRGLGQGHGRLNGRFVQVELTGRGAATRPRRRYLWLPAPDGSVHPVGPGQVDDMEENNFDEVATEMAGAG